MEKKKSTIMQKVKELKEAVWPELPRYRDGHGVGENGSKEVGDRRDESCNLEDECAWIL